MLKLDIRVKIVDLLQQVTMIPSTVFVCVKALTCENLRNPAMGNISISYYCVSLNPSSQSKFFLVLA